MGRSWSGLGASERGALPGRVVRLVAGGPVLERLRSVTAKHFASQGGRFGAKWAGLGAAPERQSEALCLAGRFRSAFRSDLFRRSAPPTSPNPPPKTHLSAHVWVCLSKKTRSLNRKKKTKSPIFKSQSLSQPDAAQAVWLKYARDLKINDFRKKKKN